jgi:hypothetical protein
MSVIRPTEASKAAVRYVRFTSTPAVAGQRLPDFHGKSSGSVCSEGQDRF